LKEFLSVYGFDKSKIIDNISHEPYCWMRAENFVLNIMQKNLIKVQFGLCEQICKKELENYLFIFINFKSFSK
jgi:hypothetical protein